VSVNGGETLMNQAFSLLVTPSASGLMIAFQFLVLVQMEQLHLFVPALNSMSASNRTAPQWQLPVYVFFICIFRF
jgi:hypothetical protein